MKNLPVVGSFILLFVLATSCEKEFGKFLDKPPGVDVTEDSIFSSQINAETYVAGAYRDCLENFVDMGHGATDEADCWVDYYWPETWNKGAVTPQNVTGLAYGATDMRWNFRWEGIRRTNILLERIDDVPNASNVYKSQVKAEARFLRAMAYFETLKQYGGIPIVRKRLQLTDNAFITRSDFEDVVNFIIADCDSAIAGLPDIYQESLRGRATKGAALALKSRTLLYAASPLFNASTPYLEFGVNNKLIGYGNYDPIRWQKAADAAKAVIDWAPIGNVELINDQGPTKNYKYIWEVLDNKEIILAEKKMNTPSVYNLGPWFRMLPQGIYVGKGTVSVTLNFIKMYEKNDGTPQVWDPAGGTNLNQLYAELDPRFAQSIAYNGSYWNPDYPVVDISTGGPNALSCKGGAWMRKWMPDKLNLTTPAFAQFIIFRLAEAYLNYAEAINEAQGPSGEAYDAINTIRQRSGMPNLPAGLSQEEFRVRVHHERAIELAFEFHRFYDIRRWMIAEDEGVMKGQMWGIKIEKITGTDPQQYSYQPYVFETRSFQRRMYLHPFPQNEVNKGYLIQNPGY